MEIFPSEYGNGAGLSYREGGINGVAPPVPLATKCGIPSVVPGEGFPGASAVEEECVDHNAEGSKTYTVLVEQPDGNGIACAVRVPSAMQYQEPDSGNSKGR